MSEPTIELFRRQFAHNNFRATTKLKEHCLDRSIEVGWLVQLICEDRSAIIKKSPMGEAIIFTVWGVTKRVKGTVEILWVENRGVPLLWWEQVEVL